MGGGGTMSLGEKYFHNELFIYLIDIFPNYQLQYHFPSKFMTQQPHGGHFSTFKPKKTLKIPMPLGGKILFLASVA